MTMNNLQDSDLEDLISSKPIQKNKASSNTTKNDDGDNFKYSPYYKPTRPQFSQTIRKLPAFVLYLCMSFMMNFPTVSRICSLIFLGVFVVFIIGLATQGSTQKIGYVKYDFTQVHSKFDFDIGKIDHWCIDTKEECRCEDPLQPTPRSNKAWFQTHMSYVEQVKSDPQKIDVAIIGQSVIETLIGKHNGVDYSAKDDFYGHIKHMFEKRFQPTQEEEQLEELNINGVALGISGDQTNNVLWRLMHGELDADFDPPFWWLVLGMEDVARYKCSEEVVVMGILRIVEEIKTQRPHAKIIVNSLFPMDSFRTSTPVAIDFEDAKRFKGNHPERTLRKKKEEKDDFGEAENKYDIEIAKVKQELTDYMKLNSKKGDADKEKVMALVAKLKDLSELKNTHEKKEKTYIKGLKHDKENPTLSDKHSFHHANIFHKNAKIPVWSAISEINKSLHRFCVKTEQVSFFDSTHLFAEQNNKAYHLLTDNISPRGHPTEVGYKLWLTEMHTQLVEWKKKALEKKKAIEEEEDRTSSNFISQWFDADDEDDDLYQSLEDDVWSNQLADDYYYNETYYDDEEEVDTYDDDDNDEVDDEAEEEVEEEDGN